MATSKNVLKALDTLKADPTLMKELNSVLTKTCAKANVNLTTAEKASLLSEIRKGIVGREAAVVAWV